MPDWTQFVRERLPLPPLSRNLEDSIIEDISIQLEDCYRDALNRGWSEEDAEKITHEHIEDWEKLASDITGALGTRKFDGADQRLEDQEAKLRRRDRSWEPIADLSRDIRLAVRMLVKKPGYSLIAILSLTVGLGAATAIFSLANSVFFKPLPIENPDQVVEVYKGDFGNHSYPDYLALKDECASFLELAARDEFRFGEKTSRPIFLRSGSDVLQVSTGMVSGNYFGMLGIKPVIGHLFSPEDNIIDNGNPVAVLNWSFWQSRFAGDPDIIGNEIDLSGLSFKVAGVAPEGFNGSNYLSRIDIWIPAVMRAAMDPPENEFNILKEADWSWIHILGRIKPGISIEQAQAQIDVVVAGSDRIRPSLKERNASIQPIRMATMMPTLRARNVRFLTIYFLAVGLIVIVVCANVTNLFAGRMDERREEISVRRALGANNLTLARQFLVESGLVVLTGGIGALLLSVFLSRILINMLAPGMGLSIATMNLNPDMRVLGFTFGLVVLCTTVIGLVPILRINNFDLSSSMRPGLGITKSGNRIFNFQNNLVMSQIMISVILLVGAGLMYRTLEFLQKQDAGFNTENLLMLSIDNEHLPMDAQNGSALYSLILERVRAIPDVREASIAKVAPLSGIIWGGTMIFEGYEPGPNDRSNTFENIIDPSFFQTMGIHLLQGRGFTDSDVPGSEKVIIVNESLVRKYWPDTNPLGKTAQWYSLEGDGEIFRVIGVVSDHFYSSLKSGSPPITYFPIAQNYQKNPVLLARISSDPYRIAESIKPAITEINPLLNIFDEITAEDQVIKSSSREKTSLLLLLSYAGLALLISTIGTYGVMSNAVTNRKQEIGIRIALGARREEVMVFILVRGMKIVLIGLSAGVLIALGATTMMRNQVYGISTLDPITYIVVSIILGLTGLSACLIPAKRVVKVNPIQAMRVE